MTVRVTTSQRPIVAASFLPPHGAPQTIEWRLKFLRNQFVRDLWRQCTGSRRLAREQRIIAQEEDWLRLTTMTDGQVVGLEPRGAGTRLNTWRTTPQDRRDAGAASHDRGAATKIEPQRRQEERLGRFLRAARVNRACVHSFTRAASRENHLGVLAPWR